MRLCHSVQPCPSILWGLVDYPALRAVSVSRPKTDSCWVQAPSQLASCVGRWQPLACEVHSSHHTVTQEPQH